MALIYILRRRVVRFTEYASVAILLWSTIPFNVDPPDVAYIKLWMNCQDMPRHSVEQISTVNFDVEDVKLI